MSKEILPQKVDPFRFADHATHLQGHLLVEGMLRLRSSLSQVTGDVALQMQFGVDEQRIRFLRGQFSTQLMLQCQRCLGPFSQEVKGHFVLGIVHTEEEADQLPKGYDPLIVKDGILVLQDVIEDELIINLPIVPMHLLSDCKVTTPLAMNTTQAAGPGKENPFTVIESLRSKKRDSE